MIIESVQNGLHSLHGASRPGPVQYPAMSRWIVRLTAFAGMAAVAFVLAHNLVFLASYGTAYQDALSRTGHDDAWGTAVLVVLGLGVLLLVSATWRLHALGVLARGSALRAYQPPATGELAGYLGRLWLRLTLATTLWFVVQENLEHLRIGEHLPGLSVLASSEYPNALLILAAVALGVAVVGALFRWRRDALVARIAAARQRWHRTHGATVRTSLEWVIRLSGSLLGRRLAVRAPPATSRSLGRSLAIAR